VRPAPLSLGSWQSLPVPGFVEIGDQEIEMHIADGHTADGTAFFARWAGVLVCGDYVSDFEIPMIAPGGSLDAYRGTLARLAPLAEEANVVVPGHGSPHPRDTALRILDEDVAYLDALEQGDPSTPLPKGRDTPRQREVHRDNLARI
jgi:glyoxylase-like metal-dependent hydrolase (beta-lactamase superfamily II)